MTTALWNIAGVAAELNVTPQAASAWHRGPLKTPEPSFRVENTGLELWTVDDIELWHKWVEEQEAEKKAAKAAKAKPAEAAPEQAAEPVAEVDTPSFEASVAEGIVNEPTPGEQMPTRSRGKAQASA